MTNLEQNNETPKFGEFKGTKSGWKIDKKSGAFNYGGIFQIPISGNDKKNRQVCNVFGVNEEEGKANALLISKSPEMLEMLKKFLQLFSESDMRPEDECHELAYEIQELIKKATEL